MSKYRKRPRGTKRAAERGTQIGVGAPRPADEATKTVTTQERTDLLLGSAHRIADAWHELLSDDPDGIVTFSNPAPAEDASPEVHAEHAARSAGAAGAVVLAVEILTLKARRPVQLQFPAVIDESGGWVWGVRYLPEEVDA